MRFAILLVLVVSVLAADAQKEFDEKKEGYLTRYARGYGINRAKLHESDLIFSNPHMKSFEKRYFIDGQRPNELYVDILDNQFEQVRKNLKNAYPFAGYSSLDTNLYNRFVKEDVESEKLRKIGALLDEATRYKQRDFPVYSAVNPLEIAAVKLRMSKLRKAENNQFLANSHTTAFARPYEDGKDTMTKLTKRMNELSKNINASMSAPKPTDEEIAVLRRLNEKMDAVAARLKALPDMGMEDHILIQAQMLSGLTDLIRRMANAVDDERRESFLYQVHNLLHFHNLQDQPYISDFEREMAHSLVSGKKLEKYEKARYEASKQRNILEAENARKLASSMKQYGNELVDKAKEMRNRENIIERQQSVPSHEQELLQQHLKNRVLA